MTTPDHSDAPVLIIDDMESARSVLRDMLRDLGFTTCVEASDGQEALNTLRNTPVRMIFCDYVMDGMSGIEFLDNLRRDSRFTNIPVIFVSAVGAVSTVEAVIDQGATDYMVKPISFRKLKRKVEEILHRNGSGTSAPYEIGV